MPVDYVIENEYMELILRGDYSAEELTSARKAAAADPAFKAPMKLLINALEATTNLSYETIEQRIGLLVPVKKLYAPYWVILAEQGSLIFGLGRMFASMIEREGIEVDVFSDRESALKALVAKNS